MYYNNYFLKNITPQMTMNTYLKAFDTFQVNDSYVNEESKMKTY